MKPIEEMAAPRLLLVDDDAELCFILAAHLRARGYEVLQAANGCQAIQLAHEHDPDVIVMDVGLPEMDGITATRALKADGRTKHIPIIMLTARSKTADIIQGLEAGAQEYLTKPFDVTEFLARVETVHRLSVAHRALDRLNARLEKEVGVKTQRLQILYEFMRDINGAKSEEDILDHVMAAVAALTGAQRITLFMRDRSGEFLECRRALGLDPQIVRPIRIGAVEGITGQVFTSGTTLSAKAYSGPGGTARDYQGNAFLSTPLVTTSLHTPDGTIGVLNVTNRGDDSSFSDEEIDCIRSMADAAAIALDNVTRRTRLQQSVRVLLETVGHLAEYRDEETTQHLGRVSTLASILAHELQREGPYAPRISDEFIDNLVQAAPMHDIGKVGIPDDILTKPGKLTDEEFQIMKMHTEIGRRVLSRAVDPGSPNPLLQMCIGIAHAHHEKFDGTGYPRRLSGERIPLAARIIALVDAYDAMTTPRRYKKEAKSHSEATESIRAEASRHFDPVIVEAFLRCEAEFDHVRTESVDSSFPRTHSLA
jgi:response regulator RpfG family c-di-GMP phosphodiesterase